MIRKGYKPWQASSLSEMVGTEVEHEPASVRLASRGENDIEISRNQPRMVDSTNREDATIIDHVMSERRKKEGIVRSRTCLQSCSAM